MDHEKNEEHNHTNDTTEIKTFSCEENILYIAAFLWCAVGCTVYSSIFATFILENSTENYYSEIMKNDLTEGRMAFEKQLDIMCAGAFSVSNDSDLKWVYFLDGLKDGDNNIAALIRCNDMLRQTFADSEHYQNYSVIMKMN